MRSQYLAERLYSPISLGACAPVWLVEQEELPNALQGFDRECNLIRAIVNINMIHIAPWQACLGLMQVRGGFCLPAEFSIFTAHLSRVESIQPKAISSLTRVYDLQIPNRGFAISMKW